MKKLNCSSCGGKTTIDENKEYAICNYCGTKYKLNEDININIKMDENTKNIMHGTSHHFQKLIIIPIIMILSIFIMSIFVFSKRTNNMNNFEQKYETSSFNNSFEVYSGNQSAFFTEAMLNKVIQNNQKNQDKLIRVIYNDIDTTDVNEIINISNSLTETKYSIIFSYDDEGYINKVTIR